MDELNKFNYAGFWKRALAYIIDQLIIKIVNSILLIPVIIFFGLSLFPFKHWGNLDEFASISFTHSQSFSDITFLSGIILIAMIFAIWSIVLQWLYYALMESSTKQATLGKMALGIKVVDLAGNRITFGRATGRFFGKIISAIILFFGYFMAGWTAKKQALHDIMSGCLVINQE